MQYLKVLALVVSVLFAMNASAITIDGGATDVGYLDILKSQTTLSDSSDAAELSWIEGVLELPAGSLSYDLKIDTVEADWTAVDDPLDMVDGLSDSIFAFELATSPEFYLIKVGKTGGDTHFLYENDDSFSFAVLDINDFCTGVTSGCQVNIGKISHVGQTLATASVPEPGTLALFGLGLLGLAFGRKKLS